MSKKESRPLMNKKEWEEYMRSIYIFHLTLGGRDETFPKVLKNMGICTICIRWKKSPYTHQNFCICEEGE